jgi:hypothetical protein
MDKAHLDRMAIAIGAIGGFSSAVTFLLAGVWVGFSAAVGAGLALGNFFLYRWIGGRIVGGGIRKQSAFSVLLALKMSLLMGLVYLLIARHWVDPLGFVLGLSALVLGLLAGSIPYLVGSHTNLNE